MNKIKVKGTSTVRRIVQIVFFVVIAVIAVNHSLEETGRGFLPGSASLHAVCPFGGIVSLYQLFASGTLVKKIHESSLVLMVIAGFLAILFGPVFCGWICPFGTFQEWISGLGKKIFGKRYNRFIPAKLDKALRFLRYLVLGWVLYMTAVTGILMFSTVDPYHALFSFWTGEVAIPGYIALAVVIVLSLFIERPFCKYACPYGAVLGLSNLVRVFAIKRKKETCISCGACDKACPMNIKVSGAGRVRDHQCISCLECTSEAACPVESTVVFSAGGK